MLEANTSTHFPVATWLGHTSFEKKIGLYMCNAKMLTRSFFDLTLDFEKACRNVFKTIVWACVGVLTNLLLLRVIKYIRFDSWNKASWIYEHVGFVLGTRIGRLVHVLDYMQCVGCHQLRHDQRPVYVSSPGTKTQPVSSFHLTLAGSSELTETCWRSLLKRQNTTKRKQWTENKLHSTAWFKQSYSGIKRYVEIKGSKTLEYRL